STPVDLPPATPAVDAKKAELANYRAAAEKAESENRLDDAKAYWTLMMEAAPPGPDYDFAKANRDRVVAKLAGSRPVESEAGDEFPLLPVAITLVVLVVIVAGLGFAFIRNKKKGEELRKKVEALAASGPATPAPPASAPAVPLTPSQMVSIGAQDRIRPGTMSLAPGGDATPPAQRPDTPPRPAANPATPPQPTLRVPQTGQVTSQRPQPTPGTPQRPQATPGTPPRPASPQKTPSSTGQRPASPQKVPSTPSRPITPPSPAPVDEA